jgi:hypothetical protein
MHALERYLPLLCEGDTPASMADLADDAAILDPLAGIIQPSIAYFFLASRYMWLSARQAKVEQVRTTQTEARVVVEQVLKLVVEKKAVDLPVALVAETQPSGKLAQVRIYHSLWPLKGRHEVRPPSLDPDETLRLAEPVATYQDALAKGDVERILGTFAEDAVVREPAGGAYLHTGAEGRRSFYAEILARGGIPLRHCTVTDDGGACAVEYIVDHWGDRDLPPQGGVAVYERATPTALKAARIYDDVDANGPSA